MSPTPQGLSWDPPLSRVGEISCQQQTLLQPLKSQPGLFVSGGAGALLLRGHLGLVHKVKKQNNSGVAAIPLDPHSSVFPSVQWALPA